MISIVIPALNESRHIGKLLDSVLAQDFLEDTEVVVADAHSKDNTREIVGRYQGKFHDVKIVDGGVPAIARNNGAKVSAGDPIFFIDADMTLPDRTFLTRNVEYFRSHGLSIATTPLVPDGRHIVDRVLVGFYNQYLKFVRYFAPHGAMCIVASKKVFEATGGYPEDRIMNEDHDFTQACARLGKYDILPVPAHFSVRRMKKEGRFGIMWKYTYATLYRAVVGPIRKPIFTYEFHYHDKHL